MIAHLFRLFAVCVCVGLTFTTSAREARWYKGNLHTHSYWSDGDDFPEMIAAWYKDHGYDFLAFSDHNTIQNSQKWYNVGTDNRQAAVEKYVARFGTNWVEQKAEAGHSYVRLKTWEEYRGKFDEPEKFLVVRGEEISARWLTAPIHMGAINVKEEITPVTGSNVVEVLNGNMDLVYEQRKKTGQPMIAHINHPNFQWALTAEEMAGIRREQFFEVYNGHPTVHNLGDETRAGTDRIWDIVLTKRLAELKLPIVYGIATDDSHHYHVFGPQKTNPGRGWVVVRSKELSPEALIKAMEAGDFYASSGVKIKDLKREKKSYEVEVDPEPGITYTIQFIGTRKGYDPKSEPVRASSGTPLRVTHRYSTDIGAILSEVSGTKATYKLQGDEIYVRAKIISSKKRIDPNTPELIEASNKAGVPDKYSPAAEFECAWTQPILGKAAKK